ncbi:MAG: beta-galactosidase trimerization domain-containing protein [Planctomycetota bacterium]
MRMALVLCLAGLCPGVRADDKPDWTYNMAFSAWVTNLAGNRYHTFTPDSAERRAKEIADAGFKAVITNGYHYRLNFAARDGDIRRIARTIADACHKRGLKVIEHQDYTIHLYDGYPLVFQHPDWLQVDAADMVTRHRIFCMNNPEFLAAYLDYLRRYQRESDSDAYQLDEIQFLSETFCGCRHCREKYIRQTGRSWPPTHDPVFWEGAHAREDFRDWMRWRIGCLAEFKGRLRDELRQVRPDVKMFDYTTTLQSDPAVFARGSDIEAKGRCNDTIGTEVNSDPFTAYPFIYATVKSRLAIGEAYGKPIVVLNNQTTMTAYFVWAFGRACRGSLWYAMSDVADGPPQEQLLRWPYQMDDSVSRSAADIGIFLSRSTRDLRSDRDYFFYEYEGWLQALCLTHNDVRVLLESQLKPGGYDLSPLRMIILPNATALSSEQTKILLDYVNQGGRLFLTYEAGTLDENGKPGPAPLLPHAGIRLTGDADGKIEIPLGAPGTYETTMKRVETEGDAVVLAASGGLPLLTSRRVGKGTICYLAAKLGPLAFEDKQLPTGQYKTVFKPPKDARAMDVIAAVVDKVCEGVARYRVVGAPRGVLAPIYSTVREGKRCRAVHLLNASGRQAKSGDAVASPKKESLPMPPLPAFALELPGRVVSAVLATPEKEGAVDLRVVPKDNLSMIEVPQESFKTYGVVYAYE